MTVWLYIIILILYSHFCKTSQKILKAVILISYCLLDYAIYLFFGQARKFMIGSLEFGWPGYQEKINKTFLEKLEVEKRYVTLSRSSGAIPRPLLQ